MALNISTKQKVEDFVTNLENHGFSITPITKKPQVYLVNKKKVNIRCRGINRDSKGDRVFWYSISYNTLPKVDYVIYITTSIDYFVMLPSTFFTNYVDRMYPDYSKPDFGIFSLDWDAESLILKKGEYVSITEYCFNLVNVKDYPTF